MYVIQTSGKTKTQIKSGDMRKLKEVLNAEYQTLALSLNELVDPSAVRLHQGYAQMLKGVLEMLPE